jgi:hypothetical protein
MKKRRRAKKTNKGKKSGRCSRRKRKYRLEEGKLN